MRIGIFVLAAGRDAGGPETYEVQLVQALARIDPDNKYFVYCTSHEAATAFGTLPGNFAVRVLRPAWRPLSVTAGLSRAMAADGLDFFHATYAAPPFPMRPFVFTMHCTSNFEHPEFYPTFIRWRLNALQRVALRRAESILCVSDFVARYLRDAFRIPGERLSTVYNGVAREFRPVPVEEARQRVRERFGIDGPYVLFVGKLQARKNVDGLARAFARFREQTGSPMKLVLAGKQVEPTDTTCAQDAVVKLGYVAAPSADPQSPLPDLYAAARMMVLPSFHEGCALPPFEAMACGCPVIVSNATSLPESTGGAALTVDPNSIEDIATAIVQLDRDEATRADLIERGLRRAAVFTWDHCARQTLDSYRKLASRARQ